MQLKPGTKLNSVASSAQVIVVRAPNDDVDVRCAGESMIVGDSPAVDAEPGEEALLLGKRYSDESGTLELLCTKPGLGPLSSGDVRLTVKVAKALPASD